MNQESPDTRGGEDDDVADRSPDSSIVDSILDGERKTVFENKQLVDSNTIVDLDILPALKGENSRALGYYGLQTPCSLV